MKPVNTNSSAKEQLRATLIVFIAVVIGLFMFFLVALYVHQSNGPMAPELMEHRSLITMSVAILSFLAMIVARKLFNKGIRIAKESLIPVEAKLNKHRSSLILYMAVCEAPAILGIVFFMLTGHFVLLVYAAVLLGFILAMIPVRKRVIGQLGLDWQQQQELDK